MVTIIKKIAVVTFASIAASLFLTCDLFTPGLGEKVDITAPVVSISSPQANTYHKGVIALTGTAKDDRELKSLVLTYDKPDGSVVSTDVVTGPDGSWSVSLETGTETGVPEGMRTFNLSAVDKSDKTANASVIVFIDNRGPAVLVTAPLNKSSSPLTGVNLISPLYTDYIDIKGEVFDRSPIQRVMITLLKPDGSILAGPQQAEGTNTWNTRFALKDQLQGIVDGTTYRYKVEVSDVAGNINEGYFHRLEIVKLKDQNSLFPSMDELGKIYQEGVVGTTGITFEELKSSLLSNETLFGDFFYEADQVIRFSYYNLLNNEPAEVNLLPPGTSIFGNLSPPENGGVIIGNSVIVKIYDRDTDLLLTTITDTDPNSDDDNIELDTELTAPVFNIKTRIGSVNLTPNAYKLTITASTDSGITTTDQPVEFFIDAEAPVLTETEITPSTLFWTQPETMSGLAAHSTNLANLTIRQSADGGQTYSESHTINFPANTKNTTWTSPNLPLDSSGPYDPVDGLYNFEIKLETSSGKITTLLRSITLDTVNPIVSVTNLIPVIGTETVNGKISVSVASTDTNGIQETKMWLLPAASPEPAWTDEAAPGFITKNPQPSFTTTIDTDDIDFPNGSYKLWLKARDKAGRGSVVSRSLTIDQNSDKPVLTLGNLDKSIVLASGIDASHNLLESNPRIQGTIEDDDQVNTTTIQIRIDDNNDGDFSDGSLENWTTVSNPGTNGTLVNFSHSLVSLSEGIKRFELRAYDNAAAKLGSAATPNTLGPVFFAIDKNVPVLNVTSPNAAGSYQKNTLTISGTASDTVGMAATASVVVRNGSNAIVSSINLPAGGAWTSGALDITGLPDGVHNWTITATDIFGKTNQIPLVFTRDTTPPTVSITNPGSNGTLISSTSYTFVGTASDATAGITAVEYSTDSEVTWTNGSAAINWNIGIGDLDAAYGSQGSKTIYFRSMDAAGNLSASVSRTFVYDKDNPVITETAVNTSSLSNRNLSFSLEGVASDSNALAAVNPIVVTQRKNGGAIVPITVNTPSILAGNWTLADLPRDPGSIGLGTLDNGIYEYQITVTDVVGKTTTISRTIRLDTNAPDLTVTSPVANELVDSNSYTIRGQVTDNDGVGVSSLQYSRTGVFPGTSITLAGINWSVAGINFSTPVGAENTQGTRTLYVRASDGLNAPVTSTITFNFDTANPVLTESTSGLSESLVNRKDAVTFGGTVSDTNELSQLAVSINGGAPSIITTTPGAWTWTLPNTAEGTFTVVFTATDVASRTTKITRTILMDTTPPLAPSFTSASGAVVTNSHVVGGTVGDGGSGVQSVFYRLNGSAGDAASGTLTGADEWFGSINVGVSGANLLEGSHTLHVWAVDRAGNKSPEASQGFQVDRAAPSLTETVGGTGTIRRSADFMLGGAASDTNGLKTWDDPTDGSASLVPYVEVSINGGTSIKVTVSAGTWSFPVSLATYGLTDGDHQISIVATDVVDKPTSVTRTITIDTTPPSLTVEGVVSGLNISQNKVNGQVSIRFGADDAGAGLERVDIGAGVMRFRAYYTVTTTGASIPSGPSDVLTWTPINSTGSVFTFTWDSTGVVAGDRDVHIAIRDAISGVSVDPNVATIVYPISIDQNSDRPTLSFDNLNAGASTNSENGFGQNPTFLLTIEDDDQVDVSLLEYRIDINNDGDFSDTLDFWNGTALVTDGDILDKWENETTWYTVEEVPGSDRALAQAKIKLNSFPQGAYRLQIRARDTTNASLWSGIFDDAGNYSWQKSGIVRYSVDYGPPSIAVSAPSAGTYNADFPISGTAGDALGVIKVQYTLDGGATYTTLYDVPGSTTLSVPFSGTIDADVLATGEYILQVEATDFGGTTATQQIPITIDRTAPTVTVLQPGLGATLNGASVTVSGEASDNRQMGAVFVWHGLVSDPDPSLPARTGPGTYNPGAYTQATGGSIWNLSINTTLTVSTSANAYRIRVVAIDGLGNVGTPVDHLVTINQNSDRPVISFSNLSIPGPSRLALGNLSIIGTALDDDSVRANSFDVRIDRNGDADFNDTNEGWIDVSDPPGSNSTVVSWVHEITDLFSEGLHHVQVRALDVNDVPGNYATGYNWNESAVVPFFIDNGPPALTLTSPVLGQRFSVNQFTLTGSTQDTNGIKRVVIWVDNDDDAIQDAGELVIIGKAMDNSGTELTTDNTVYNINQLITGLADGVKTVRVTSYDSSDAVTVRELSVVIDTTAPSAVISTPGSGSTVNGSISVVGTATDNYQVSKVYYNTRLTASGAPSFPGDYTLLVGQTYAWNFSLATTSLSDGAYTLRVVVEDSAGNNSSSSPASVNIVVDQNTDKPIIDILTLEESNNAVQNLMPPSLAVSGTVQDDDSVNKNLIQVRLRTLPAGAWGAWGAISAPPASNTSLATWSHVFTGLTDGQYEFELRAADTLDPGTWTPGAFTWSSIAAVPFAVDSSLPVSTLTAPVQASFHRTNVAIGGSATDASGIKKVSIAYDEGSGYGTEQELYLDSNPGDGYATPYAWSTNYAVTGSNDGQVFFRLTVTDAFDKIRTYEQYFTVDTIAPTVSFLTPIAGSTLNGSAQVRGSANDTYQINSVWFKVNNVAGPGTWASGDPASNGWTLLSGTYNWDQRFKTTDLSDGPARVYILSIDNAGNRSDPTQASNQLDFVVNSSQNLPVISITTPENSLLDNTGFITGTVSDDDGVNASTIEVSIDGGAWQAVTNQGTSGLTVNFSHAVAGLPERGTAYTVRVRASDIGEDFTGTAQDISPVQATSSIRLIKKDDSAPVVVVSTLNNGVLTVATLQGAYVSDELTLVGTSSDGVAVATLEARLPDLVGHDTFASVTNTGTNFSTWSWSKSGLVLSGATQNVELRVTDVNGRVSVQAFTLLVDVTLPSIGFDSTTTNPDTLLGTYNGTYTFRGNSSDNVMISRVYYRFAGSNPGAPDTAFTGWTQAASTYAWTASFDTTSVHNLGSDLAYGLYAVSVDAAGNVSSPSALNFVINQNSNRPNLSLTIPGANQVLETNAKAQGSISDDDGLATAQIRIDRNNDGDFADANEGYVAFTSPASISGKSLSLEHVLSTLSDGYYKLQVLIRDTGFVSTPLTPFNEVESGVISFSIDTLAPSLGLSQIVVQDRYGGADHVINSNFNGSYVNNDFTLVLTASDANGLASVETSIDNSTWNPASDMGGGIWNAILPIASFTDGTKSVYYRASDVNGKVSSGLLTILVDKTNPSITFLSPSGMDTNPLTNAPNVNGTSITITGAISDASVINSLVITGGISDQISFTNIGNTTSWSINFDGTSYDDASFATETGVGTNVWRLPIKLVAYDTAGNRTISTAYVDLDPDGDKPIVIISTPTASASVTGIITLNGTITDDDGTSGQVDIFIDANNDGDYVDAGIDESYLGVTVSNGAWSQQINTLANLTGTITFMVTPRDVNGKLGDPMTRSIFIDSSLPQIVGYNGSAEIAAPSPSSGTRQKGLITIRALFKDDDNIPPGNIQVSLDGGTTYVAISTRPGYSLNQLADAGGKKRYDVQFQVDTATYFSDNSGTGSLSVILQITDNTYKPAVVSLSYATDNRPPEAYWDAENTLSPPQNGVYSFSGFGLTNTNKVIGTAWDGGAVSGVSYVDVYFVKSGNILNPKTGSGIPVTLANTSDNLYTQIAMAPGNVNAGSDTITLDRTGFGTVNNTLPVRFVGSSLPGGLEANVLYYVRDVVGNSFKVYVTATGGSPINITTAGSGAMFMVYGVYNVPYTQNAYTVGGAGTRYAIRIDKRTELGSNDGNANGDTDGFQESLKDKGGYDEWFAYLNTTLLPDGPLDIYFVAYDENGNKVLGKTLGQITNNPPSITSFVVGGNALSGSPIKAKYAGVVDLTINANDIGGNNGILASSWKLEVLGRYGADGGGDLNLADVKAITPWYYGQNVGGNWKAAFTSTGSGAPAQGLVSFDTSSDFVEGDWYLFTASVIDNDGNTISRNFYVRVNNNDNTAPVVTLNPITQASVSSWTAKNTPLSVSVPAANVDDVNDRLTITWPSWILNNTRVMFSGITAPPGLSPNTLYYVRIVSGSYKLSTTTSDAGIVNIGAGSSGTYNLVSGGHVDEAGSSLISARPAVSGAILLTGTVSDDSDVQSLTITIDGGAPVALTPFNKTGDAVLGYSYQWAYLWDTSTITTGAKLNVDLVMTAADFSATSVDGSASRAVDVTPYITAITDPTGLSTDVLRGSTGRYSISSHATNTLNVRGYNLGRPGYAPAVRNSANASTWATGTLGAAPTVNSVNEILVSKNWTRSGFLTIVVNSAPSANNLNGNPDGLGANTHNAENTADPRTLQWNDDRYVWVWATNQLNLNSLTTTNADPTNLTYFNPTMVMNGNQPDWAFNDDNNGLTIYTTNDTTSIRRTGFRKMHQAVLAEVNIGGGTYTGLQRFIATSFDAEVNSGDNTGMLEVTAFENQTVDNWAQAYGPSVASDGIPRWPTIQGIDYHQVNEEIVDTYRYRNRFPHTKMIAETSTLAGGTDFGANIYLTYHDASLYAKSLNFVSFRFAANGAPSNASGNLISVGQGYLKSPDVIEIPGTGSGHSSQYYDMAKVGTNGIAVAYYDPIDEELKLTASTNAFISTPATPATENLTNKGREQSLIAVTVGNRTSWAGKYFIVYSGATAYGIWYNRGGDTAPAAVTGTTQIQVNISAVGTTDNNANRNAIVAATLAAVRAAAPSVFELQRRANNSNSFYVIPFSLANTTDIASNLAGGTVVGSTAKVRDGSASANTWNTITLDSLGNVGQYVSIINDGTSKLYVAYYDFDNANLKFARISWNAGVPSLDAVVNVDNYLSAGSWTNLMLINNATMTGQASPQPVIAYYADSYGGTKKPIRFAYPKFDANGGTLQHGTTNDGVDDEYSGNWEIVTIPAVSTPQGGAWTFNQVQLGQYTNGVDLPVLGWAASKLEYAKLQPNN